MLGHINSTCARAPCARYLSNLRTASALPSRQSIHRGTCQVRASGLQQWYTDDRRRLLQGIFAGIVGAAVMGRTSTALAASSKVSQMLENVDWPEEFPFQPEDFSRYDESPDIFFYGQPRFVTHIDDGAIGAITKYYESELPRSPVTGSGPVAVLDMCSSWISHFPSNYKADRIAGLGMNRAELEKNPILTEYDLRDLNVNPSLPFEDNSFDAITNVVSVDYLSKPIEIFKEMHRVLKPGGVAIMSFSNRCFPTKAISMWTSSGDADHAYIVGAYFHYSVPGGYTEPKAIDISPSRGLFGGGGDPMYVVTAKKTA